MAFTSSHPKRLRPYWYVDAKWACGLLVFLALSAALLLFNLSVLTQREHATTIAAAIMANMFSREGLNEEASIAEFRQRALTLPGETVAPIEHLPNLQLNKQDIAMLSAEDLKIMFFKQITGPLYDMGLTGAAAQVTGNPDEQKSFAQSAGLLGIFTRQTHEMLHRAFIIAAVVAALFMAGVMFFSAGWGRLVSPAVLLMSASWLGALAAFFIVRPPHNDSGLFSLIPPNLAPIIGETLMQSYGWAWMGGAYLLLIALAGKVLQKLKQRYGGLDTAAP